MIFRLSSFVFLIVSLSAFAQKKVVYQQLSIKNGLSHNTINVVFQDSRGFMWFGTQNGLNRYDGSAFEVFHNKSGDTTSISSNDVYTAFEDWDGHLWFGTRSGLSRFNRETNSFTNLDYQLGGQYTLRPVWCIIGSNNDKHLWIGASGGLFSFHPLQQKFTHYKLNDSIQNANSVRAIYEDRFGELWVAPTVGPLMRFDRQTHEFDIAEKREQYKSRLDAVTCLTSDSEGSLWIGSENGILSRYSHQEKTFDHFVALEGKFPIRAIMDDREGQLWVGTDKGGTFLFDKKTNRFVSLVSNNEGGSDVVLSFYNDLKGDVWLGTYHGGAYLFDKNDTTFRNFEPYEKLTRSDENNSVMSVCEVDGTLWIGTDGGGLVQKTKQSIHYFKNDNTSASIQGNTVLCQAYSQNQKRLYFGTYSQGLAVRDDRSTSFHTYTTKNGLSDNSVWAILPDQDVVWIGTNKGGLNLFDPVKKTFRHFTNTLKDERSISSNTIRCILKDSRDKLWIGTVSGLNRMNDDSTFTSYFHQEGINSVSDNNILCLYEDSRKYIWMGTHGGGLNKYDYRTNTFTSFNQQDGLAGTIVYRILEDDFGNLWMSTNKGISRLEPEKKVFRNFDERNGLPSAQFNIGAAFKSSSGEMFFGTVDGVCSFFPNHIRENSYVPPIVITDFLLFNKPVVIDEGKVLSKAVREASEITLDHGQNVFSFRFSALNFTHADKNSFAYRLEPFDKDWIYSEHVNQATYTNLDPGEYTFKVKGSNNDGLWNESFASIKVLIKPPFWKTYWFRILAGLVVLSGIYTFYQLKVSSMRQQKQILKAMVRASTLEIEEKNKLLLETQQKNAEMVTQQLNAELAAKSSELTKYTLLIIQKNKLLDDLKTKLKEVIRHPASSNLRDFKKLVNLIHYNFSPEKEWSEFNHNFDRVHRGFAESLKKSHPELTLNDIRLCSLYRIGIPTKDIAEAMGISQTSVKMARYRLRKKLGLSPEDDIVEFLNSR